MKYLVFGNGYLGNMFSELLPNVVVDNADITDEMSIRKSIEKHQPDAVINCAGKTGKPNVDWCEDHKLETVDVNVRGPLTLLRVCSELDQYWVQLGSGCIYSGDNDGKGWSEEDVPNFMGSYYSKTKAIMNEILRDFPVLQVRLRMPVDSQPGPRNLITKITGYEKVISVPNSITVVNDAINAIDHLAKKRLTGIYNLVNPGAITHEEILDLYTEIVDPNHKVEYISPEQLLSITKAPRSNTVLNTEKLTNTGAEMPEIHVRMKEIMNEYKERLVNQDV